MAGEEKMVGKSWREARAGCFRPPQTLQMVAVLIWSLPEGSQGIIFSSSPFQRDMEEGSTIKLGIKKDLEAMVQAETWFKDTQKNGLEGFSSGSSLFQLLHVLSSSDTEVHWTSTRSWAAASCVLTTDIRVGCSSTCSVHVSLTRGHR